MSPLDYYASKHFGICSWHRPISDIMAPSFSVVVDGDRRENRAPARHVRFQKQVKVRLFHSEHEYSQIQSFEEFCRDRSGYAPD